MQRECSYRYLAVINSTYIAQANNYEINNIAYVNETPLEESKRGESILRAKLRVLFKAPLSP